MKKIFIILFSSILVLSISTAPVLVKAVLTPSDACGETCARLLQGYLVELENCQDACAKPDKTACGQYCDTNLPGGFYRDYCNIACLALDGTLVAKLSADPASGPAPLTVGFFADIYNYTDNSKSFKYTIYCNTDDIESTMNKTKDAPTLYEASLCTYKKSATAKLEVEELATSKKASAKVAITVGDGGDKPKPPAGAGGACQTNAECKSGEICDFGTSTCIATGASSPIDEASDVDSLIRSIARWIAILISVVAVIFITLGGVSYVTAGGDAEKAKGAKSKIMYGLIGLAVAALAWGAEALVRSFLKLGTQ